MSRAHVAHRQTLGLASARKPAQAIVKRSAGGGWKAMGKNQHVVSLGNRWAVKEEGAAEPFAVFKTQSEAWEKAKSIARKERTGASLHGRAGRIGGRNPSGHDPTRHKG